MLIKNSKKEEKQFVKTKGKGKNKLKNKPIERKTDKQTN